MLPARARRSVLVCISVSLVLSSPLLLANIFPMIMKLMARWRTILGCVGCVGCVICVQELGSFDCAVSRPSLHVESCSLVTLFHSLCAICQLPEHLSTVPIKRTRRSANTMSIQVTQIPSMSLPSRPHGRQAMILCIKGQHDHLGEQHWQVGHQIRSKGKFGRQSRTQVI